MRDRGFCSYKCADTQAREDRESMTAEREDIGDSLRWQITRVTVEGVPLKVVHRWTEISIVAIEKKDYDHRLMIVRGHGGVPCVKIGRKKVPVHSLIAT